MNGRSPEKNKVGDRSLPPVVRTVGLMKMKKDNVEPLRRRRLITVVLVTKLKTRLSGEP